ncbi:potassium/proton antiporter [Candidatus Stoquefichus sp. SB1]|uniref:potassium/proton antiporter n=1 Tax=Candidatus Stoquefichus sp. SB1 TaxID=1658109 RepID=UPI0009E5B4C8|nr:potassium/proton antiporter [Candidatus Stoquefichus sp. SB1]
MNSILLIGAIVIIICMLCSQLSNKFGIPVLFFFILLGMIFGSDGLFKIPFEDFHFAENLCSIALIFIIFYGGFTTNWKQAKKVAPVSIILSSLGVILTAIITGLFCYYVLHFEWLESLLIGSVLSSTDAASVFSILRSKQLNLKYKSASLLELESGSNDPWAYTLTVIILSLMSQNISIQDIFFIAFSQIVFGLIFGAVIAYISVKIFDHFQSELSGMSTLIMVAIVILSYALPSYFNGNGYISAYIVGIVLGNIKIEDKKGLVHFFDGIVELFQMFLFFLLGLLAFPSQIPSLLGDALWIALFITFLARPAVVWLIMKIYHRPFQQILLVSFAGLRGATSIVFAIMVTVSSAYTKNDIFHIVFCIVLLSIAIQGTLLPYLAKYLFMIDEKDNVLKTFTDYSEETNIQFINLKMTENHPWIHMSIKDIVLPPQTRIVMIKRHNIKMIPKGDRCIEKDDELILSAFESQTDDDMILTEMRIDESNDWLNCYLKDLELHHALIILIKRQGQTLIPTGDVQLLDQDIIVMAHSKK